MSKGHEVPLAGGRTTAGVVRIGDAVHRPPAANAALVRRLLTHLEAVGFDGVPRYRGRDAEAREVFEFIPGDVPADLGPHADAVLAAAAGLIRRYHDASVGALDPAAGAAAAEVVCHNDLSPCNMVFRAGLPVALIDFDAAAPGRRSDDLGYAAWLWLDIGSDDYSAGDQRRRLRLFLDGYGGVEEREVLRAMLERQAAMAAVNNGTPLGVWAAGCRAWVLSAFWS